MYTTHDRLARDGLVAPDGADPAEPRRRRYRLTDEGRARADRWLAEAPTAAPRRDDLVLRVLLTAWVDPVTARAVVDVKNRELVARLQEVRHARRAAGDDLVPRMAADAGATRIEADLRRLDLCDERLRAAEPSGRRAPPDPDAPEESRP